jgi:Na+-transporting methylmalonyl-CoA/oxaloacetate decarboxylase gamma subunit
MDKTRNTTWHNEQNKKYHIIHFIIWYFLFCSLCHVVFLVLSILSCGISCFVHCVMWYFLSSSFYYVVFLVLFILSCGISCFVHTKQEIPYNKMDKTRNTTWHNEQNKKYHIIKWTKQEIPYNKMDKTSNTTCLVHIIMWYFLFCSLCHVVFLVLFIVSCGISCFVHFIMWYFLFCSLCHVVFLVLSFLLYGMNKTRNTTWHNEQNKKYHMIIWTKQEIPYNKMNKTRNTTW